MRDGYDLFDPKSPAGVIDFDDLDEHLQVVAGERGGLRRR
jgi:hypothetical protein